MWFKWKVETIFKMHIIIKTHQLPSDSCMIEKTWKLILSDFPIRKIIPEQNSSPRLDCAL